MRLLIKIAFTCSGILFLMSSCRKGSEDPFFTFHTRKDRVAGTWQITEYERELTSVYTYPNTSSSTVSFRQTMGPVNYSEFTSDTSATGITRTGKVGKSTFIFDKKGNWSSVIDYYLYAPQAVGGFYVSRARFENEGTWEFQGKTDEYKKKESMLLKFATAKSFHYTYTSYLGTVIDSTSDSTMVNYGNGERSEVWKLIGLNTNRLVAEISSENSFVSTVPSMSGTKVQNKEKIRIVMN